MKPTYLLIMGCNSVAPYIRERVGDGPWLRDLFALWKGEIGANTGAEGRAACGMSGICLWVPPVVPFCHFFFGGRLPLLQ